MKPLLKYDELQHNSAWKVRARLKNTLIMWTRREEEQLDEPKYDRKPFTEVLNNQGIYKETNHD